MDTIGIDMLDDGRYMPPEILSAELIKELSASRPLYPEGIMDLAYDLTDEGIEPEVLQCRYICSDSKPRSLLDIIDKGHLIDEGQLEDRLAIFKRFCELEAIRGTQLAMIEIVADVRGPEPRNVACPRVELHGPTEPNTPVTGVLHEASRGLGFSGTEVPSKPRVSEDEIPREPIDLRVEDVQAIVFIAEQPPYKTALLGASWDAVRARPSRITSIGSPLLDPDIQFLRNDMLQQFNLRERTISPRALARGRMKSPTPKEQGDTLKVPD